MLNLDLEVLDLAVEILRHESKTAPSEGWAENCEEVADALADIIEILELDRNRG